MDKIKLDIERTLWANERTMLAYIRTAFASLILGFGILRFATNNTIYSLGFIAVIIGIAFIIAGMKTYGSRKKAVVNHKYS